MKKILTLCILLCLLILPAFPKGSVYVHGYYRSNGTYVQPYTRSAPGSSHSSPGNYNYETSSEIYHNPITTSCQYTPATTRKPQVKPKAYPSKFYITGYPKGRSEAAKKAFLRSKGFKKVPKGYQVDHKIPLWQGGADTPANMELLTTKQHQAKTKREMKLYWKTYPHKVYKVVK